MATRMQQRRGTAAEWTSVNPVLAAGEIGFETDTGKFKMGDGVNAWSSLQSYGTLESVLDAPPETLDTLNELAAALNDDPDFYTNITSSIDTVFTQLNTSISTTRSELETDYNAKIAAETTNRTANITAAIETESLARQQAIDAAVSTEQSARSTAIANAIQIEETNRDSAITTAIQTEITNRNAAISASADTLTSAYIAYADQAEADAISTAALDATSKSDDAEAAAIAHSDAELAAHNLETLNVHGIADTSVLATTNDVSAAQTAAEQYADSLATNYDPAGSAAAAQTAADGYSDGILTAHNLETTGVHGIADTADLALLSAASQTFSGDITISGNFTVSGTTTTVSAQDLVVTDPLIYIGEDNASDALDLGIVASYTNGIYQHTGLVRDASDDKWKLFTGVTDEPTTVVNFAQGSLDNLAVNNVEVAGVVFTDGIQSKVGVPSITEINQKTAAYTLSALTERDTIIEVNSSSATTVTIPLDSALDFPVGSTLDVIQTGTGQVTIAGAVGVTVNATPGLKLRTQWSSVTLLKRGPNLWLVYGDTAA